MKVPLPLVTGTVPRSCQSARFVEPCTLAWLAPGAVRLNCTCPLDSRINDPGLIYGTSMPKAAALNANSAGSLELLTLME